MNKKNKKKQKKVIFSPFPSSKIKVSLDAPL